MSDDRRDEFESGDTGATGRQPRPTPPSDREFDELDSSFADLPEPTGPPAFFEEDDVFADEPAASEPPPVEDFGFDDIARGDEPAPGSRRSSRRGGLRAREDDGGEAPPRSRGQGGGRARAAGGRSARLGRGRGSGSGGGGGRRPASRRPSGGGGSAVLQDPRARLGIIALAVLLLLVVAFFWFRNHQRSQLENSYKSYINEAAQITGQSAGQGRQLLTVLQNADGKAGPALAADITRLAAQATALAKRADELSPPSGLNDADRALQTTLQMRANGLSLLAQTVPLAMRSTNQANASRSLADGMKRFLASDVVYNDLYYEVASAKVQDENIDRVEIPNNQAFLAGTNDQYATQEGAKTLLEAMKRGGSGDQNAGDPNGPLRGTSIEGVTTSAGTQLSDSETTQIAANSDLEWVVNVRNGGEMDETDVEVTVSLSYGAGDPAYTKSFTIANFPKGTTQEVRIPGPGADQIQNDTEGLLTVESARVPGERQTDNNTKEYSVTITFG